MSAEEDAEPNAQRGDTSSPESVHGGRESRPLTADELRDLEAPQYRIRPNLSTDDPHWRTKAYASLVLAAAAGIGAWSTHGSARLILALTAAILLLPAVSLASMTTLAALLKRLEQGRREDA
jgi:hypothetical protein